MTRTTLLAAAVAAFLLPASGALAATGDPLLDSFQSLCRATGNDYLAVGTAATTAGWTKTQLEPDAEDATVSITDKSAYEKTFGPATVTLLESRGLRHTKAGDIPESNCKLSSNKPDAGAITETQSWLGFAPDAAPDPTLAVFYVTSGTGAPQHIPQSGLNAAMSSGGFSIVKVQTDSSSAILDYQSYSK